MECRSTLRSVSEFAWMLHSMNIHAVCLVLLLHGTEYAIHCIWWCAYVLGFSRWKCGLREQLKFSILLINVEVRIVMVWFEVSGFYPLPLLSCHHTSRPTNIHEHNQRVYALWMELLHACDCCWFSFVWDAFMWRYVFNWHRIDASHML